MSQYALSSSPTDTGMWDSAASKPRSAAPTCGMVVHPDGTSAFVNNKEAYFAAHPDVRAATEASLRDYAAYAAKRDAHLEAEVRAKADKQAQRETEEKKAGLHVCVGGKVPSTCRGCKGNGCADGLSSFEEYDGKCDDCEGKGFALAPCEICEANEAAEKTKKGSWKKQVAKAPVCIGD